MNAFSMLMFKFAQSFVGFRTMLGVEEGKELSQVEKIVKPIDDLFDVIIVPLLSVISAAGTIYAIVLGVNYSKAESSEKRDEARKRLINTIIGFVVVLVLLVILRLFTNNISDIKDWITGTISDANAADKS